MSKSKRGAGRPSIKPKRITSTVSATAGERLEQLAAEADVKLATFCAHILERYALQGANELMSNDILIARLNKNLSEHNTRFAERFGDVLLRIAHEITAERRYTLIKEREEQGKEKTESMRKQSWKLAVDSLHKHVEKVEGNSSDKETDEEEPASS